MDCVSQLLLTILSCRAANVMLRPSALYAKDVDRITLHVKSFVPQFKTCRKEFENLLEVYQYIR